MGFNLFKNNVGRPSNEILSKRRNFKLFVLIAVIIVVIGGTFIVKSYLMDKIESSDKNISIGKASIIATNGSGLTYNAGTWATKVKLTAKLGTQNTSNAKYTWYKNEQKYTPCTTATCSINSTTSGYFSVVVQKGVINYKSSSVLVKVDSNIINKITLSSNNNSIGYITSKIVPGSSSSGYKYQWYKDGVLIDGAKSSSLYAKTYGTYTLKVTTGAGTTKSSSIDLASLKINLNGTSTTWSNKDYNLTYSASGPIKNVSWYKAGKLYPECSGKKTCVIKTSQNSEYCVKATTKNGQNFSSCAKVMLDKSNDLSGALYSNGKKVANMDGKGANTLSVKLGSTLSVTVGGTLFCSKYTQGYKYYWYKQKNYYTTEINPSKAISTSKSYKPTQKGYYTVVVETCNFQSKTRGFTVN